MPSKSGPERYPLHQSPLYKIRGKGQFEKVIGVKWDAIDKLLRPKNYRVWPNKEGREIQQPLWKLAAVHGRIAKLLSRIELPNYVFSKKGRSYVDNARQHVGTGPLIKTDIYKFYPSVTRDMVYRLFAHDFQCAVDIAHRLADICCYRQKHVPTGSELSGRVAFFAARHMFDEIATMATERECRMTAYVDDITVSGRGATKRFLGEIRKAVRRNGLKTKQRKSRTFAPTAAKAVTGAIVAGEVLRLPNVRHLKIWKTKQALAIAAGPDKERLHETLRGRLQEANQVLWKP
jgi:hypothetical protein